MATGWIRLHRKTLDSAVADDMTLLGCWSWLLLNANWQSRQLLDGTTLQSGQLKVSMERLASAWNCSKSAAHRRMQKLQCLGMIDLNTETIGTVVTIVNWGTYQESNDAAGTIAERSRNAIGTMRGTRSGRERDDWK